MAYYNWVEIFHMKPQRLSISSVRGDVLPHNYESRLQVLPDRQRYSKGLPILFSATQSISHVPTEIISCSKYGGRC